MGSPISRQLDSFVVHVPVAVQFESGRRLPAEKDFSLRSK